VLRARDELGLPVACVTFAPGWMLRGFAAELPGLALYGDVDRALYRALGFGRGSFARVWLDPRVWARYARLLAGGRRVAGRPDQDTLQLGGDAVVAPGGEITWLYRSRGPDDRPPVDAIVRASRAAWTSASQDAPPS
jgi:hypothetical protein